MKSTVGIVMSLAEQRGGAEQLLMHLLRGNRAGPGVPYALAFLADGPLVDEVRALGYPAEVLPVGRLRQVSRYARAVLALRGWMQRTQAEVVMAWMAKAHLYSGLAARLAGVPAVWWQHGIPTGHWLDRAAGRLPARSVFCCSRAAEQAQRLLSPSLPTRVIYPAVDLERFDPQHLPPPEAARAALGIRATGPVIGIVGRLQRWKGPHVFLEAASILTRARSGLSFVVVGGPHFSEPAYPGELALQVSEAGIADDVRFAGHQADVALWMQALDILVLASISPEPFGMVVLEGMALGKPVVATRGGGPSEIITDQQDGVLVAPDCAGALVTALASLIDDADRCRRMGSSARRRAAQFGTRHLAEQVARSLEEYRR